MRESGGSTAMFAPLPPIAFCCATYLITGKRTLFDAAGEDHLLAAPSETDPQIQQRNLDGK
jgi:hypothetical protein